ncbi:hypothetical protein SAMN05216344_110116 [Polaromonas sp. OV174]|uniref:hypothetical protein n=1 Tax=Polaromonas sp. OV174 TaxID=1855300 RepID=UPI0008E68461|nr:hypothetical protein [Polaromonas sp. OV174]SFC17409.1 hypothetical protein SAMN05216344_110116 [Polaromonas sp. OV174]
MNLPDTITFHAGSATVAEARDLDPLGFTLDGAHPAAQNVLAQTPEYDLVVNVVGLPDAGSGSGWVLLLG